MTTTAVNQLEAIGFTEYEARAYLLLLREGPQTGYHVAKVSGIPRPNIYPVLSRLVERGAVNKMDAKGRCPIQRPPFRSDASERRA